jgi:phage shock protein C
MDRKLLRNMHDKVIAGVSSGIAEYMQVDVTIIRLLFVLSTIFLFGTGVLVYLVMWIIVPENYDPAARFSKFNGYFNDAGKMSSFNAAGFGKPEPAKESEPVTSTENTSPNWTSSFENNKGYAPPQAPNDFKTYPKDNETGRTVGGLFLLVIGIYFMLNEFDIIPFWFSLSKLWPLIFVAIGLSFILKSKRKNDWEAWKQQQDFKQEEVKKSTIDLNKNQETDPSINKPL